MFTNSWLVHYRSMRATTAIRVHVEPLHRDKTIVICFWSVCLYVCRKTQKVLDNFLYCYGVVQSLDTGAASTIPECDKVPRCAFSFSDFKCFLKVCSNELGFYPRDAMLARVIEIATCLSVCLSRAGIVSKRRKLAARFLHHLVAPRL